MTSQRSKQAYQTKRTRRLLCTPAAALIGALALAGCSTAEEAPEPTIQKPETVKPAETQDATGTADEDTESRFVLPGLCEDLNPKAAEDSQKAIADLDMVVKVEPVGLTVFNQFSGPRAEEAFQSAIEVTGCQYPLYLHGQSVWQWAAEIPEAQSADFIAALEADYDETEIDGTRVFAHTMTHTSNEGGPFESQIVHTAYVPFGDGLWLASMYMGNEPLDYVAEAIASMKQWNDID
ncbi:hypothetical protein [Leucobacter chinensis]|uniref:hypothetical protein n=1 Tax=Leucobacter chinensis TaxID=2851010 RepID=UPI001C23EA74|nr:hypothetical protein [Leucobacter chinensis]